MVKVKIEVPAHVAEYLVGKYYDPEAGCVRFPSGLDIYILIWDLLRKRPAEAPVDTGNLEFALPDRREGKNPETYNYLSKRAGKQLAEKMRRMMMAEIHDFMDENKHAEGIPFKDSAYRFICKYGIESITEDALLKNYQRWRNDTRRRYKRNYIFRKDKKKAKMN